MICRIHNTWIFDMDILASCWYCLDGDECADGPMLNGTMLPEDSIYSQIGCTMGCWVSNPKG